jgi:hypothetical protein
VSAFSEMFDVLEHIVRTHTNWNVDLSQEEALAKVVAARVEAEGPVLEKASDDVDEVVSDVKDGVEVAEGKTPPVAK